MSRKNKKTKRLKKLFYVALDCICQERFWKEVKIKILKSVKNCSISIKNYCKLIKVKFPYIVERTGSTVLRKLIRLFNPVEKGKIMFITFQGDYTCNPKYICEEVLKRDS